MMCERNYSDEEKRIITSFKLTNPHVCVYCGKTLKGKDVVTIDHKIPVCKGGVTTEENLVIACFPCNKEKDDMTVEEYIIYKQKQQEFTQELEVNRIINDLITIQNNIMSKYREIDCELAEIEKEIITLQDNIMCGNFNACEGFFYTKNLNELLLKREELKIAKVGYNHLNTLMGGHRKDTIEVRNKIQIETSNAQRVFLKKIAIGKCKKQNKTKSVPINEVVTPELVETKPSILKSNFIPIPIPSTPVQPKRDIDTIGTAIHKTTKAKLQVISKVDEDHYVVKRKGHGMQVMLAKNIINLELAQTAK